MTKEKFERDYAERSGVTVEWLHEHGREAVPCDCGDDLCEGWAMHPHVIKEARLISIGIVLDPPDPHMRFDAQQDKP